MSLLLPINISKEHWYIRSIHSWIQIPESMVILYSECFPYLPAAMLSGPIILMLLSELSSYSRISLPPWICNITTTFSFTLSLFLISYTPLKACSNKDINFYHTDTKKSNDIEDYILLKFTAKFSEWRLMIFESYLKKNHLFLRHVYIYFDIIWIGSVIYNSWNRMHLCADTNFFFHNVNTKQQTNYTRKGNHM